MIAKKLFSVSSLLVFLACPGISAAKNVVDDFSISPTSRWSCKSWWWGNKRGNKSDEKLFEMTWGKELSLDDPAGNMRINAWPGKRKNGPGYLRFQKMSSLFGKSLFGLEIFKIRRFIDYLSGCKEIDEDKIAMWGLSKGGTYTLFTLPLDPRIKVGIISAYFNQRLKKLVVDDPRYSCSLRNDETHMFLPGLLTEFTDSDLVSLICPRPLMIQTGKADNVSWWPLVLEEFEKAREHYQKLEIEDKIEMCLHNGGHEICFEEGSAFLKRWL